MSWKSAKSFLLVQVLFVFLNTGYCVSGLQGKICVGIKSVAVLAIVSSINLQIIYMYQYFPQFHAHLTILVPVDTQPCMLSAFAHTLSYCT